MRPLLRHPVATIAAIVAALVLVAGYATVLRVTGSSPLRAVDEGWQALLVGVRSPAVTTVARFLDGFGGGFFGTVLVPAAVAVAFLLARRPWSALGVAVAVSVAGLAVNVIKTLVDRARPEDILVDISSSAFPSGHSAHAAALTVAIALVLHRRSAWVAAVLYTLLMMASRTYLGAHWLTDTIGGALLGAALAVAVVLVIHRTVERVGPPARRADPVGSRAGGAPR